MASWNSSVCLASKHSVILSTCSTDSFSVIWWEARIKIMGTLNRMMYRKNTDRSRMTLLLSPSRLDVILNVALRMKASIIDENCSFIDYTGFLSQP